VWHVLGISGVTVGVLSCTLLPFLPGDYDSLAIPFSAMARIFGKAGLLLVPVGITSLVLSHRPQSGRRALTIAVVVAGALVTAAVALAGWAFGGFSLGIAALAAGVGLLIRAARRPLGRAADYLVVVPVAVFLVQMAVVDRAIDFSRSRAIENSAPLIAEIERYRVSNGRYPVSLYALSPDYKPGLIGIKEFRYEPSGDAYNLAFEQLAAALADREIVMYNPLDQHAMTAHAIDLLQLTPEALRLEQSRGHHAVHDAPQPHWKYYWFD
jgi:hypothetical protein